MRIGFVYRRVEEGKEIPMPHLEQEVENVYPNHQQDISRTMRNFGLKGWTVIFFPSSNPKAGRCSRILKKIWLSSITTGVDDTLETLYHELFHAKCPDAEEGEVEEMGKFFYSEIKRLTARGSPGGARKGD